MPQKFVPEAETTVRAFDQARDVCDRRPAITGKFHDTDNRMQRSKRIRCHLGACRRNFSEQCRFARVWITDEAGVRDRAQFEQEMALFAFLPFSVLTRGAIARALEMHVSFASRATPTKNKLLILVCKIDDKVDLRLSIFDFRFL